MMQKRQQEKIGQYIQAKYVNGFSFSLFFLIYIKQSQYEQIQKKRRKTIKSMMYLYIYTIKKRRRRKKKRIETSIRIKNK